jgi:Cu-Zn family superoxide dismutase
MKRGTSLILGMTVTASMALAAQTKETAGTTGTSARPFATARLMDGQGRAVGEAHLQQTTQGVLITLDLNNAVPGTHAVHVHRVGRCDAPTFESAGDHFEPASRQHGYLNPRGHHAGDLPNLEVPASKAARAEHLLADVTLTPGPRSLMDGDGAAIVLHADKDDYLTDPAGASGDRIACGRIMPSVK